MSVKDFKSYSEIKDFAPVLLIAFNRPDHFYKTLIALGNNKIAHKTVLYVSIDGPRNENDKKSQELILEHIRLSEKMFSKVFILKNQFNKGLAQNIIDSITYVLEEYEKIIVVEDDLVTSNRFLNFMNDALAFYEDKKKVWHINGHNVVSSKNKKNKIFLWRFMNCWGWATWRDRWVYFERDHDLLIQRFNYQRTAV